MQRPSEYDPQYHADITEFYTKIKRIRYDSGLRIESRLVGVGRHLGTWAVNKETGASFTESGLRIMHSYPFKSSPQRLTLAEQNAGRFTTFLLHLPADIVYEKVVTETEDFSVKDMARHEKDIVVARLKSPEQSGLESEDYDALYVAMQRGATLDLTLDD